MADVGPYSADALTRIYNVQWGGGAVFVIGTFKGNLYYVSPNGPDDVVVERVTLPVTGGSPDDRNFFHLSGSAFGAPTTDKPTDPPTDTSVFVVCGLGSEASGLSAPGSPWRFFSFICSSSDGRSWTRTYKGPQGEEMDPYAFPWSSRSNALVFSPAKNAFYYSMVMDKSSPSGLSQHEQIFSSADGSAWAGPISDRSVLTADNGGPFLSAFPANYCSHNEGFDDHAQHVPDGVMSTFSDTKDIAMRPKKPPTVFYYGDIEYWPEEPSGDIEILTRSEGGPTQTTLKTIPDIKQITAVGGSGTTWIAGGWNDVDGDGGAIAISFDTGETWAAGPAVDSGVVTIAWSPKTDAGL